MPDYTVELRWTACISMEADSEEEAKQKALATVEDGEVPLHKMEPEIIGVERYE